MKLKRIILSLFASIAILMTSCAKIDSTFDNGGIPTNKKGEYVITFNNHSYKTKALASTTSGTGYDEFNLFTWNSVNDTIMNPYLVQADGENSYIYEGVNGQELKYFKKVTDWYDFIGIIPTTNTSKLTGGSVKVDDVVAFTVDDKRVEHTIGLTDTLYWKPGLAVDSPEEFLWSYRRVEKANYGDVVELPFNHGNALVFLGFSSDKTDTKIIDYIPSTPGSTVSVANPQNGIINGYAFNQITSQLSDITDEDIDYINSLFTFTTTKDGSTPQNWVTGGNTYVISYTTTPAGNPTAGESWGYLKGYFTVDLKSYLESKYPTFAARTDNSWGYLTNYYLVHVERDGNNVIGWFYNKKKGSASSVSAVTYTTTTTPDIPAIEGVRLFTADSLGVNNLPADTLYCVHIPHTVKSDATISSTGCVLSNRTTSNEVVTYSLPVTTTLSSTPNWSATTFYALPGDSGLRYLVVKLSYTYDGVTVYDVRVPIKLPDGGLVAGKYYKYDIYITSTSNGTNDPDEARDEKDEILIEDNPVISVKLTDSGYTQGDERTITI